MRGIFLLTVLILLAPIAMARTMVPDPWNASGRASWGEDVASAGDEAAELARSACHGALRAGAFGPMPAGPNKGQYRFWVEASADEARCDFRREGWISDPRADANQIMMDEGPRGTMVTFLTDDAGQRSLIVTEWDDTDPAAPYLFVLAGEISERTGPLASVLR